MTGKDTSKSPVGCLALVAAFITFFLCYNVFHFLCRDYGISTLMAILASVFVFKLLPTIHLTSDPTVLNPNPKLYNLTPMYAMPEVKDALTGRYFGDKRWYFEDASTSKNTLSFNCKFNQEEFAGVDSSGQGLSARMERKDYTMTLKIFFEPLGDGCTARLHYEVIGNIQNQVINELCKATTETVETELKALEKRLHG